MKSGLLAALLSLPLACQTLTGVVEKIEKGHLQVKSRDQVYTLEADEKTSVRKLKTSNDLATLAVGDEVRVNYYGEQTLMAVNISAKVSIAGVITESRGTRLLVEVADRKNPIFVSLNPGTKLSVSRGQLTAGRRVHVIGWDAGEGIIEAGNVSLSDAEADRTRH